MRLQSSLDLSPEEAENIHQGYLKLKGMDEIQLRFCRRVKKYLSSFTEFVEVCEEQTPESRKLFDILNLEKVIKGQKDSRIKLTIWCHDEEQRLKSLKEEVEATKQRIGEVKTKRNIINGMNLFGNGKNIILLLKIDEQ